MKNTKKKNGAAKGKGRAALSAQQTIPYLSMHPDGVCKLPGGLYTKTVEYEDINYSVASTEDQTAIFGGHAVSRRLTEQKEQRYAYKRPGGKADQLPSGQIEHDLGFDFG